ncbi:DMT family transporter [Urechidicola sp. KH5]
MNSRLFALLAAFIATFIYGINYTIAKDVMPSYVKPYGFIIIRILGALPFFVIASLFHKWEKVARTDYKFIVLAAVFGASLNMLSFFKGLDYTTPINASVIMVMVPIIVFGLSVLFLKERLIKHRVAGVIIGLIGAIVLITYGKSTGQNAPDILLGNLLIFCNATLYAFYLIVVKKLLAKYHPLSFVVQIYFVGFIVVLPFGANEFLAIEWGTIPESILYKILFVVIGTTFLTYILNLFALIKLKPTTVSSFVYLQPVIATVYALVLKSDELSTVKIVAAGFIFLGVFLVSKPVKKSA